MNDSETSLVHGSDFCFFLLLRKARRISSRTHKKPESDAKTPPKSTWLVPMCIYNHWPLRTYNKLLSFILSFFLSTLLSQWARAQAHPNPGRNRKKKEDVLQLMLHGCPFPLLHTLTLSKYSFILLHH